MDGKWSWNGFLLSSSSVANQDCANPGTEPDQFYGTGTTELEPTLTRPELELELELEQRLALLL
jgi:hypothetical protein